MDNSSGTAGGVAVAVMVVQAYAAACGAAGTWVGAPATRLADMLGLTHAAEIEALRDAAAHREAVGPWAAATARALMAECEAVVERGAEIFERSEWQEDDDGRIVEIVVGVRAVRSEAAGRAARELLALAEAIERRLDIEAAMERYGLRDC